MKSIPSPATWTELGPVPVPEDRALVREQAAAQRLVFTSDARQALPDADLVLIAVGTPSRDDGSVDMTAMDEAGRRLAELVRAPAVVVIKPTMPLGTAQRLRAELSDALEPGCRTA